MTATRLCESVTGDIEDGPRGPGTIALIACAPSEKLDEHVADVRDVFADTLGQAKSQRQSSLQRLK